VELCLKHGSVIDDISASDRSTAVHIACAQGALDLLKVMFELQPNLKDKAMVMRDVQFMTPLHRAVMFDHVDVVEYLLKCGADIDSLDKENRTPLLLAASRNCLRVVSYLINNNANIELKDSKKRNMLHLIVNNQGSSFKNFDKNSKEMLSEENKQFEAQIESEQDAFSLFDLSKELVKVSSASFFWFCFIEFLKIYEEVKKLRC
jgi:transient receptor potential cation channel subfamily A protein 1